MVNTLELKAARARLGYSQEDCAKEIECSTTNYCDKENNKSAFDIIEATKLCHFLKIEKPEDKVKIFLA